MHLLSTQNKVNIFYYINMLHNTFLITKQKKIVFLYVNYQ